MKMGCYLVHSVSTNTRTNAQAFSHCSVQGHHHSEYGISYHADHNSIRWAMSVGCLIDPNSVAMKYMRKNVKRRPIIGCGALVGTDLSTLVISDTHAPYHHKDTMKFLLAAQETLELDTAVHVGDIVDNHYTSFHDPEYGAYSPEDELKMARAFCQELEYHFPELLIAEGNHDLLNKRKAKTAGISEACLRSYNDNFGVGKGWDWQESHFFEIGDAQPMLLPMVLKSNGRWNGKIL